MWSSLNIEMPQTPLFEVEGGVNLVSLYVVVTADVIRSRQWKRTPSQEDHFRRGIAALNERLQNDALVPFSALRGDEIQGVLRPEAEVMGAIRQMRYLLRPLEIRVGVGVGEITTGLGGSNSWEMDGPSFHMAREALDSMKGGRRGRMTMLRTDSPDFDEVMNLILLLMDSIISRWTPAQWVAIDAYSRLGTYRAAAAELGIALQNVEKRCSAARWGEVRAAEEYINEALRRFTMDGVKGAYSPARG